MIHRILLILILLLSISSASIHTIRFSEPIRDDYFYTIPSILEQIPELQVRSIDATDQDISRLGQSTSYHNSVALYVNGVKSSPLQDGQTVMDLRPVANGNIDSIVVYTGLHAVHWAGNSSVVINIISSPIEQNSIGGTAYTGSEMGDPTVLLKVMDSELIPYNKEQLAAGEVYGTLITKNIGHYGGLNMIYMDRYSNGNESLRARQFGDMNSTRSMEEVRKAYYTVQYNKLAVNSAVDFAFVDYNLFRWDRLIENFNYYEGTRGHAVIREEYRSDDFWVTAHFGAMYEDASLWESKADSIDGQWGDLSLFSEIGFISRNGMAYSFTVTGGDQFGETPIAQSDSSSYLSPSDMWRVSAIITNPERGLIATVSYPPAVTVTSSWEMGDYSTVNGGIAVAQKFDDLLNGALYSSAEMEYVLEFAEQGSLSAEIGIERRPKFNRTRTELRCDGGEIIPWSELSVGYGKYIRGSLFGSAYGLNGVIQSEFIVNGLTVGGGISGFSKSRWAGDGSQLPLSSHSDKSTLPSRVVGNVKLTYALFNNHLKMVIAVRDIGGIHRQIPSGSKVGPVVVSNFSFGF